MESVNFEIRTKIGAKRIFNIGFFIFYDNWYNDYQQLKQIRR